METVSEGLEESRPSRSHRRCCQVVNLRFVCDNDVRPSGENQNVATICDDSETEKSSAVQVSDAISSITGDKISRSNCISLYFRSCESLDQRTKHFV